MDNNVPYLCGGILFDLILQARKNRTKARNKLAGGSDGLSDTDVMKGLIYVITGEKPKTKGSTLSKATSQYKTCEISGNTYIPFKDSATISAFDSDIKGKNSAARSRMSEFIRTFLNEKKLEWLSRALLEIIKEDTTIPNNQKFNSCGVHWFSKDTYEELEFINADEFLISILHFILTKRPDNEKGKETFSAWFSRSAAHAEWKFDSDIGSNMLFELLVTPTNERLDMSFDISRLQKGEEPTSFISTRKKGNPSSMCSLDKNTSIQFAQYLKKAKDFYSKVKTLLYAETPRVFEDFYVCNTLEKAVNSKRTATILSPFQDSVINMATASILKTCSHFVIISGTGGIGKSMMLRHLLLQSIDVFEGTQMLPILVSLKNYSSDCNLREFIYQTVKAIDNDIKKETLYDLLDTGNCILLLDGLDEINTSLRDKFEIELEHLTIKYPDNTFVITSRPTSDFLSYHRFTVMKIQEFSKDQALELIDKLDFYDKEAKQKFREDLDKRLFNSHKQFASNPLLLTIMLMTYSSYGDVPRKMHVFYAKAYETMARLHDATKGAYKRPLHTKLEPEEFAEYFAQFCAGSYMTEVLEFTQKSFYDLMNTVIARRKKMLECTSRDFLLDLKDNLCLIYEEGDKYYFIHRSFQEYFTAVFFSRQLESSFGDIADIFRNLNQKTYHDKTFDMLYDMIPERIDRFIFVPYLHELLKKCDSQEGYWTFLQLLYPVIYSYCGDVEEWRENTPEEYFYDFIINENLIRYNGQLDDVDWPASAECFKEEYAHVPVEDYVADQTKEKIVTMLTNSWRFDELLKTLPDDYEVDYCGQSWTIRVDEILSNKDGHGTLIKFMESDEFPLKKEYLLVRKYATELFDSVKKNKSKDDIFGNFI